MDSADVIPTLRGIYETCANQLVRYFPSGCQDVLELGSGTGIATLSLLRKDHNLTITGVEISPGMSIVAGYKFHQIDDAFFEKSVQQYFEEKGESLPSSLGSYWRQFREKTQWLSDRVTFQSGDINTISALVKNESADAVMASQVLHWVAFGNLFPQLYSILKPGGAVVWSTASHFYNDAQFPAEEWGFRFHDFVGRVFDELRGYGIAMRDYKEFQKPKEDFASIRAMVGSNFRTEQVGTALIPIDFESLLNKRILDIGIGGIKDEDIPPEKRKKYVSKAVLSAFKKHRLKDDDNKHKYDILTIFKSSRIS